MTGIINGSLNLTTPQANQSTDIGINIDQNGMKDRPFRIWLTIITLFASFTLIGNILIIRVLADSAKTKLRTSTKYLICYVSASHCLICCLIFIRFFDVPCLFIQLPIFQGFNVFSGMFFLALEIWIVVKKPHSHHKFVTVNRCKICILLSIILSVCLSLVAYAISKKPNGTNDCYLTNGILNPWFLCIVVVLIGATLLATAVTQISVLNQMKRVFPENLSVSYNVSHIQVDLPPATPAPTQGGHYKGSALYKLTKMLITSLVCSIICWSPTIICVLTLTVCNMLEVEVTHQSLILAPTGFVTFSNGSLHALVYMIMSSQIRGAVKDYLKSWICLAKFSGSL